MGFRGILVIFRFGGYFGHFLGFGDILVIFWVSRVFWSFCRFHGYFGNFEIWGILVIFEDFRVLWPFTL